MDLLFEYHTYHTMICHLEITRMHSYNVTAAEGKEKINLFLYVLMLLNFSPFEIL